MAQVVKLVCAALTDVDLLSGNIKLSSDGWETTTSNEKVWETITLVGAATDANIRTTKDQIDDMAEQARQYNLNPRVADEVWFQWNADSESAKQALVYEIQSEILAHESLSSPLLGGDVAIMKIAIQRHPENENTSATTDTASGVSTLGGQWTIGNISGSSPQRIQKLQISTADAGIRQEIWVGIRPLYEGVGSFTALWEAEDGGTGSGVTSPADGTASGGNKIQADLTVTANDGLKSEISIANVVGSNYNHFIGKYHVLARMKVASSATQVMVELAQWWKGSYSSQGITFVDGETSWKLFSLGTISLPPFADRGNVASGHADFDDCGFAVLANSVDDTGTLDIDCYVLIPAEHSVTILGAGVDTTDNLWLYTDPDEGQWAIGESSQALGGLQPSFENWEYPVGGGLLVVAAQASTGHTLSRTVAFSISLYPRWKSYRG
jgi:hypothetical protein